MDESQAGRGTAARSERVIAVALAVLGAWSTAILFGELVMFPAYGVRGLAATWRDAGLANSLLGAFAMALMLGTPFAVVAFFGVASCLRERRAAVAVPLLFAAAWGPVLLLACIVDEGDHGLHLVGGVASWVCFSAMGWWITRSEHRWIAKRVPRDARVA